ncbi:GerMN domain-containing protein [Labedaea rhizosphaerae]|uniref:GerMN domain-containing protein n=1 Tax=Labedaea rhizosphaerae TaxID=598644 RepID=A0A4R6S5I7_LABRH|nr:GerMN domain-containing protein [Labedaea rhizosphaerae]TDP95022.1 hypothetical protein EV186_105254 [Labedaea rhizosphaerae]
MTRLLATLLVVLAVAGCGVRPSGVIPGLEAPAGPRKDTMPTLYFVSPDKKEVVPVDRIAPALPGADVLSMLAAGPDEDGRGKGLSTQVPRRAAPAIVTQNGTTLEVWLHTDVAGLSKIAVDQIVCTLLLQYPRAERANLHGGSHTLGQRTCPAGR